MRSPDRIACGRPGGLGPYRYKAPCYADQYTDAETRFQYLRARYYDPATGQFLSRDPITAQTRSPYAYTMAIL
jgi:RHS repeat-associated protein